MCNNLIGRRVVRKDMSEAGQKNRKQRRSGQAMTEFVVVAASLLLLLTMLALFLYTYREYGGRVLNLVASEFP